MLAWVMTYTNQINKVFQRKTAKVFIVLNPFTVYNAEQIASVSVEFVEGMHYNKLVQKHSHKEMGFRPSPEPEEM
ncbi:MAG: hypothetical protein HQ477_07805 [Chloroflexi bacterium]|jgi:hypothetical protein|nr:hypothetical protein [Chloroflexota bacterium]